MSRHDAHDVYFLFGYWGSPLMYRVTHHGLYTGCSSYVVGQCVMAVLFYLIAGEEEEEERRKSTAPYYHSVIIIN